MSLAFVFHFNQHTHEYAEVANRACYRGLLTVLRAHPALKFNLHFSGTLLRALNWFDPGTLDLVRDGIAAGQFEMLGSTYAQNVLYACDDWDNAQQIGLHRAVLAQLFGVQPVSFWLAERCWRQSLAPVIAGQGYRVVPVEDHILRAAGLRGEAPARTGPDTQPLTLVYDDPILRERFNYAVWFGRRAQLFNYLDGQAARAEGPAPLWVYAEDAEAMGLWPWEAGYLPQAAWANLDRLLTEFEERGAAAVVHLAGAKPHQVLDFVPDGSARWMDRALQRPDAPFHEAGYQQWFDYLQHSPKVGHFRRLFAVVRSNLQQVGEALGAQGFATWRTENHPPPASAVVEAFYRQAVEAYCSHQYEFGCIGVGGRGDWGWENVRATFLYTRLAEIAARPEPRQWIEDLNGDGADEQLLSDGQQLIVLTAYGGRLLGWFDLRAGRQWVGNALAVPQAPYVSGASEQPRVTALPVGWLPDTFEADLRPWKAQKSKATLSGRLGRYLSPELFTREADEVTVYTVPEAPAEARPALPAQTGALNDWVSIDGAEPLRPDDFLDYRFEPDGAVCYLNALLPELRVDKRVRLANDGVRVTYTLQNLADRPRPVRWRLTHELAPDYAEALSGGRPALQALTEAGQAPGVRNTRTGAQVVVQASRAWADTPSERAHLLALEVGATLAFTLAPGGQETFEVLLQLVRPAAGHSAEEALPGRLQGG